MSALGDRLSGLEGSRRALFEALAGSGDQRNDEGPVAGTGGEEDRLSFAQRRLWFVDQLHPGNTAYNVPLAVRLDGHLDVTALHTALQAIVDRHTVLRTVLRPEGGEAVPHVLAGYRLPLPVLDPADPADPLADLRAEAARPFDLEHDAPIRVLLIRLRADDHVLMVTMHHIVTDGWSVRQFFDELSKLYRSARAGDPPDLEPLPIQYADFARWQRERMSGERLERLLDHWRAELSGAVPLDLPTDRPRPAVFDHTGASCYLDLPEELVARLRRCAQQSGATLYMTLLAGFAATLARWTGQDDLTIGGSVAGRDHPAVTDLVGFFVNTVAMRLRVDDDPTFVELIGRARSSTLEAYAHQELPFDLLVDALDLPRDPSRPPLVNVMFLLDETPDTGPPMDGLTTRLVDLDASAAKYDLMINLHDTGDGVRALVEYATALFDDGTIRRLLDSYLALLSAATEQPDAPVSTLPVLGRKERWSLLFEWNDTAAELGDDRCLHELFEQQSDQHPDAPALVCAGSGSSRTVSYRELEERANRLAHHLIDIGVRPAVPVGLALRRGPDLVVAILGVLKAGGAYVPLDPDYPADRLEFMLRDVATPVVVTTSDLLALTVQPRCRQVVLDRDGAEIAGRPATRPTTAVHSRHLGYVIYTSGSTGTPKGIALEHRGVVNNLRDLNRSHGVGPGDAVLSLSSPSFDMSVYEILGMLGAGGTVVLPDPAANRDPAHWVDLITTFGVTVWNSAPALLDLLLDQLEHTGGPALGRLRLAMLGGDWIPVAQPDRIRAFAPDLRFLALGGATEASIHSIAYLVDEVDPAWRHLPYGRPMANQRAYVLDERSRLVPVGVAGELHLGGVGLARGYVGRQELTAERFVTVEFGPGHRERLYRTGDLARIRPDGVIELLGRTDFRIKLNGLRIEPGEVEHVLRAQPGVRDAVVIARQHPDGRPRLVGYAVADDGAFVDEVALRSASARALPPAFVPAAIEVLDRLPLSPNGKVDRKALPTPTAWRPAGSRRTASPATPVQTTTTTATPRPAVPDTSGDTATAFEAPPDQLLARRIAAVWEDVLDVDHVGPDDDFFALGGDSFGAVRAVRAVSPNLRVVELFTHTTPRALAERMHALRAGSAADEHQYLFELTPPGQAPLTLVCFPHGGGDALAYRPLADHLPAGIRLVAVSPPGHDPARPGPMLGLEDFTRRCAEEIVANVTGPFAVYGHCAGVVAALETTRLLEEAGRRPTALYLAAALPEEDPDWSLRMEQQLSDGDLVDYLRSLGGFDGALDARDLTAVVRMVRHDMVEAARFFQRHPGGYARRLATPLTCLFTDDDEATSGYRERFHEWARFVTNADVVTVPDGGGHYFAKQAPDRLAAVLAARQSPGPATVPTGDER